MVRVWVVGFWSACCAAANNRGHRVEVNPFATICVAGCGCRCFRFGASAFRGLSFAGHCRLQGLQGAVFDAIILSAFG